MNLQGWKGRHKYGFISMYEEIRQFYNLHFDTYIFVKDHQDYYMLFSILFYSVLFHKKLVKSRYS